MYMARLVVCPMSKHSALTKDASKHEPDPEQRFKLTTTLTTPTTTRTTITTTTTTRTTRTRTKTRNESSPHIHNASQMRFQSLIQTAPKISQTPKHHISINTSLAYT
jgi:hypothetical protein